MSIISVTEEHQGLTGVDDVESGAELNRRFFVTFNSQDQPVNRPVMALLDQRVPQAFSRHPAHPWLYVRNRNIQPIGPSAPFDFYVDVTYSSKAVSSGYQDTQGWLNPLTEVWDVEWAQIAYSDQIDVDRDGKAIINANGETPDPPLSETFYDICMKVTRNEARYTAGFAAMYINYINSDWFMGSPPGTARCMDFSARRMRHGSLSFWSVHYEFVFHLDGWSRRVKHMGMKERKYVTGSSGATKVVEAIDADGNPVSQPILLDKNGFRLADGANACWLYFNTLKTRPFYPLGIY